MLFFCYVKLSLFTLLTKRISYYGGGCSEISQLYGASYRSHTVPSTYDIMLVLNHTSAWKCAFASYGCITSGSPPITHSTGIKFRQGTVDIMPLPAPCLDCMRVALVE